MNLQQLGCSPFFQQQVQQPAHIGRVILEHKHAYRIMTLEGELLASVSGSFAYRALRREQYPAVGDFVVYERMAGEDRAIIHQLLTRKSMFTRKAAGLEVEAQIVAANVDVVFLVMSMNEDFNVRRLERYLVAAWDSGATPVVVLTKKDVALHAHAYIDAAERVAIGVDVVAVSAVTGEGMDTLKAYVPQGVTGAFVGSSGVGKSTLTNAFVQAAHMHVSHIREDDAKGRHTTTHRELIYVKDGGCIIDTPGMRELQLWQDRDALQGSFTDIEELEQQCRFRNCTHEAEPHCAVQRAIEEGTLEASRLRSFKKLQREVAYLERKQNEQAQLAEKRRWKQISKALKKK